MVEKRETKSKDIEGVSLRRAFFLSKSVSMTNVYSKSLELDGTRIPTLVNRARVHFQNDDIENAKKDFVLPGIEKFTLLMFMGAQKNLEFRKLLIQPLNPKLLKTYRFYLLTINRYQL